jgi:hypothetical protein
MDLPHLAADRITAWCRHAPAAELPSLPATPQSSTVRRGYSVKFNILVTAAVIGIASLGLPLAAQAQGIPDGMAHGANEGGRVAGPLGVVVGGAVGGVIGGIQGVLGIAPVYAAYPEGEPRLYHRHRHWTRHTRRHMHHMHTTG